MGGSNIWFYFSLTLFVALASISCLSAMLGDLDTIIELYGSVEPNINISLILIFFLILNFTFFSFTALGKINK